MTPTPTAMQRHAREYFIIEAATVLVTTLPLEAINIAKNQHLDLAPWLVAALLLVNTVAPPLIQAYRVFVQAEDAAS